MIKILGENVVEEAKIKPYLFISSNIKIQIALLLEVVIDHVGDLSSHPMTTRR